MVNEAIDEETFKKSKNVCHHAKHEEKFNKFKKVCDHAKYHKYFPASLNLYIHDEVQKD